MQPNDQPSKKTQKMASSPQELIDLLVDISFMPPDEYRTKYQAQLANHFFPLDLEHLPQNLDQSSDPRREITAAEIEQYAEELKEISLEAKRDGEILWGRIQASKYERKALDWAAEKLRSFGIQDVRKDEFPARRPLWTLTVNELTVIAAPGFEPGQSHHFFDAITAFPSANTPAEGVEAEIIYVGEGSVAELRGRDLADKVVLLRARSFPGVLWHSARTAYSRIATGDYGRPQGVIAWWDVPGARQIAGRMGSVGGGDELGEALPWISIGNDDGFYLRKLIDRATLEAPVKVRLNVQGHLESGKERMSANVYGLIPGKSGKYIVLSSHVDCYFYGIHDNAATTGMVLAIANYYASRPQEERAHGLICLIVGDHENPGVGGTDIFIDKNRQLVENDLLMVFRPEKLGLLRQLDEGFIQARSNVADPLMLMITNRSPLLIDIFKQAIRNYAISVADFVYSDPAADETNFHPPYNELDAISVGFSKSGIHYHTTSDADHDLVSFEEMEKLGRAHAFVIDQLAPYTKEDLQRDAVAQPDPEKSIYQSELFKMMFGNY